MTRETSRRRLLAGVGATALASSAGCSWVDRDEGATVRHDYGVEEVDVLTIETETGDLSVSSRDRDDVLVEGEKRAASEDALEALSLDERREGDRLAIESDVGDGPWPLGWWRTPIQHLDVGVPPSVRVERAVTGAGELEVEGVVGPLEARADDGNCYVSDVGGPVDARTDTGNLIVRDASGPITARTDTGNLTVDGVVAGLRTDTGAISATVRGIDGEPTVAADTGDVDVALDPSLDVTISVRTETGSIDVHGGRDASISTAEHRGTVVLGEGSGQLAVEADTGDVTITVLE